MSLWYSEVDNRRHGVKADRDEVLINFRWNQVYISVCIKHLVLMMNTPCFFCFFKFLVNVRYKYNLVGLESFWHTYFLPHTHNFNLTVYNFVAHHVI